MLAQQTDEALTLMLFLLAAVAVFVALYGPTWLKAALAAWFMFP